MKGTEAKRNVCRGSCVSTGAKFPLAPVESAPMMRIYAKKICDMRTFLKYAKYAAIAYSRKTDMPTGYH